MGDGEYADLMACERERYETQGKPAPRERPIPFSILDVRAILDGRKAVMRRIVQPQPASSLQEVYADRYAKTEEWTFWLPGGRMVAPRIWRCPYGVPGDRLWVKEPFAYSIKDLDSSFALDLESEETHDIVYRADDKEHEWVRYEDGVRMGTVSASWESSRSMPRWASRILLKVVSVRVERVQEITEDDAIAEGMRYNGMWWLGADHPIKGVPKSFPSARQAFKSLWDEIHAKHPERQWAASPWVWVIEFRRVQP